MDGKFKKNDAENMEQFTGAYSASPDMLSSSRKRVVLLESIKAAATISLYPRIYRMFHLSQLVTMVLFYILFVQNKSQFKLKSFALEMWYANSTYF